MSKCFNGWVQIEIDGKVVGKVYNLRNLGNLISYDGNNITVKIKSCNKMNGIIERYFGNCITADTKFKLHNITSKTAFFMVAKPRTRKKER
jgi:hypothetical protein